MKIENETQCQTRDIKKLLLQCCRVAKTGRDIRRRLTVYVVDNDKNISRANYSGTWAKINIGHYWKEKRITDPITWKREVAWVAVHEFLHSRGISHRKMTFRYPYYNDWGLLRKDPEQMAWVDNYQLRLKEVKPIIEKDTQMISYQRVLAKVEEYKSKVKRVNNKLRDYLKKQRRYERVLVAAGKIKNK
jgi:hypothetical protein